ncbi:MAG: hypothetical protein J0H57_25525, partial [Rhodospirillales bacterium]|nr:hypothetical protein [Rhodospirillales bacterium]
MAARAFITGVSGTVLTDDERAFLRARQPWGFILFKRNVDTPAQVKALVEDLRSTVGRPDAPDADVARAAITAGVGLFADGLPDGLATMIGEKGFGLSGGERQGGEEEGGQESPPVGAKEWPEGEDGVHAMTPEPRAGRAPPRA